MTLTGPSKGIFNQSIRHRSFAAKLSKPIVSYWLKVALSSPPLVNWARPPKQEFLGRMACYRNMRRTSNTFIAAVADHSILFQVYRFKGYILSLKNVTVKLARLRRTWQMSKNGFPNIMRMEECRPCVLVSIVMASIRREK